jgi:hypothetical protein
MSKKRYFVFEKPRRVLVSTALRKHKVILILQDQAGLKKNDHLHELSNSTINLTGSSVNNLHEQFLPEVFYKRAKLTQRTLHKDHKDFQV